MNSLVFYISLILLTIPNSSGADWTSTPTGSEASLRGISAVSDRVVWVSGSGGTVLRTTDSGAHWQRRIRGLPSDLDFRAIQTYDGRIVTVMAAGAGEKSAIYRTTDAGEHWTLVHQNKIQGAFFDGFAFFDALRGLLVGDPVDGKFFLLTTSDGGQTWSRIDGPTARDGEGAFAASNTSLVVHRDGHAWFGTGGVLGGRVFNSYDWGRTWTGVSTTIPHDTAAAGVFSLAFPDASHGYASGGDYQKLAESKGVLSETMDGGASWHEFEGAKGYRSAIVTDGHHIIVTGPSGTEMKPANAPWQPVEGDGYHALSLAPKGKVVWASGSKGRIAHMKIR
jgi:photosystem II stability/assembly factor-like uncharacterized protein